MIDVLLALYFWVVVYALLRSVEEERLACIERERADWMDEPADLSGCDAWAQSVSRDIERFHARQRYEVAPVERVAIHVPGNTEAEVAENLSRVA